MNEQIHLTRSEFGKFVEALREIADIYLSPERKVTTPTDILEGFEYLFHMMNAGIDIYLLAGDPDRPEFVRMLSPRLRWAGDNPDALYYVARIRGDRSYRIRGKLNGECYLSFTVHGRAKDGGIGFNREPVLGDMNDRSIEIAPDGSYEIILSPEKHPGNWLHLQPNAVSLMTRHYFENEISAQLAPDLKVNLTIESLTPLPAPPPNTDDLLARRIADLIMFLRDGTIEMPLPYSIPISFVSATPNELPQPASFRMTGYEAWAAVDVFYCQAPFRIQPDEALVIKGRFPDCAFANVVLWNRHLQAFDYRGHRISLNRKQTIFEPDGSFRMVIAHKDPGVPNWLDTAGHTEGTIFWRFLLPKGQPEKMECALVPFSAIAERGNPDREGAV